MGKSCLKIRGRSSSEMRRSMSCFRNEEKNEFRNEED
jgi:hypothetical protein